MWGQLMFNRRIQGGKKTVTKPTDGSKFNGQSAPLWVSPNQIFFKIISNYDYLMFLSTFSVYAFYVEWQMGCQMPVRDMQALKSIFFFVQALTFSYLKNVEYAADTQWARYTEKVWKLTIVSSLVVISDLVLCFILLWPEEYGYYCYLDNGEIQQTIWENNIFLLALSTDFALGFTCTIKVLTLIKQSIQLFVLQLQSKFMYRETRKVIMLD